MAYVAVKGGDAAISNSIDLLTVQRSEGAHAVGTQALQDRMSQLVDRVMCEAGLYAPEYAALALKQSEGSLEEAVFLIRAYRSTLPRGPVSHVIDGRDFRLSRRISSAFKDIPQGQILGATYDYTHRLLNFSLARETEEDLQSERAKVLSKAGPGTAPVLMTAGRVSDLLRDLGVIDSCEDDDTEPKDITKENIGLPMPRSARLQTLFRADTGFVSGVAYAGLRGYGFSAHPTIGELRTGRASVTVPYLPDGSQSVTIGEIPFTEVEAYVSKRRGKEGEEFDSLGEEIGYGLAFGRAETKAIAMSILDAALNHPGTAPPNDEEFVLLHGEALEMSGFISHLKLPHYVTFQSKLDDMRKIDSAQEKTKPAQGAGETGDGLESAKELQTMSGGVS